MLDFTDLNFLSILLAAIAKFIISGLWFSKYLWAKDWLKESGLKVEDLNDPARPMMISFLSNLLFAFTMAIILSMLALDLRTSLALAVIMAIGLTGAQTAPSFAFEGRSLKLYLIYAIQYVVEFIIVTLILVLM